MARNLLSIIFVFILAINSSQAGSVLADSDKGPVVRYYPNPIKNVLTVEIEQDFVNQYRSVELKVVNLLGQQLIPSTNTDLNSLNTEIKLDLSDIPPGIYFLEVYSTINGVSVKQTRKITKS